MDTLRNPDRQALSAAAFAKFRSAFIRKADYASRYVTVGFSGGTSLTDFYREFVANFGKIPLYARQKARFAMLDERLVEPDSPDSNYRMLSETVFQPLIESSAVTEFQILPPVRLDAPDPASWYDADVMSVDIGLFGVGEDGHIASLFPEHPALEIPGSRYLKIENAPKDPPSRIGVSLDMAKGIPDPFVFFMGEGKRQALDRFLDPNVPVRSCPVRALSKPNVVVVTDLEKRDDPFVTRLFA